MTKRPYIPRDYKNLTRASVPRNRFRVGGFGNHSGRRRFAALSSESPRLNRRSFIFGGLLAVVGLTMGMSWIGGSGADASTTVRTEALTLPSLPQQDAPLAYQALGENAVLPQDRLLPLVDEEPWDTVTVKSGQTLGAIFSDLGLSASVVHHVVHTDENTQKLTKIFPGDQLLVRLGEPGQLKALQYRLDEQTRLEITESADGYRSELLNDELTRNVNHASGVISDSLFLSGQRAGLSDGMIMEMANLFGWDIDFVLDIREGDSFHVIYEKVYRDGEFIRNGNILAATFINQNERFQAVRFEKEEGDADYYSPDGRNMKKAFLRAPLKFSRVSSNFNPRRRHPVTGRVTAHRGVDYAAPVGSPVVSVGDGKVTRSGYDRLNGHHVFIRHPNGIITKYLHFKSRAVKNGARVKQGQTIGYLGGTGRVTGPHLHYEFLVNGVHRNPRTVKLPTAQPLAKALRPQFEQVAEPLLSRLEALEETHRIALAQVD